MSTFSTSDPMEIYLKVDSKKFISANLVANKIEIY
jgi:hypothetical protein